MTFFLDRLGADDNQCNCPASSALDFAPEQPSPLVALWRHLTGDHSASVRTTEEALLTPAEWRQDQQDRGVTASALASFATGDAENEGEEGGGEGDGDSSLWQSMLRAVGVRSGNSKRTDYSEYEAVQNPARGDGDIELGVSGASGGKGDYVYDSGARNGTLVRRNASGESVLELLPGKVASKGDLSAAAIAKGCGCGKGNCKCGNSCMCGDSTAKIVRAS